MPTTVILICDRPIEADWVSRVGSRSTISTEGDWTKQAKKTAHWIKSNWKPISTYSSLMDQALETTKTIGRACGTPIQESDGLRDLNYGKWKELTTEQVSEKWPELLLKWREHPEKIHFPKGEKLSAVSTRVMSALKDICWVNSDKSIILICHAIVNRLILLRALRIGNSHLWHLPQDSFGISVIEKHEADYHVRAINCTSHLK